MRAGYLELDRALMRSLAKFVACGIVLAAALWLAARFAAAQFAQLSVLRDETTLLLLIVVGVIVYAGSIMLLFGTAWLKSLVRG